MEKPLRILGIDPGLNHTGFGVIDFHGNKLSLVDAGCIHVPTGALSYRLGFIFEHLSSVIQATQPNMAAIELIFVNINPKSTLLLGQARGAAITCAAYHGLTVNEFTPTEIKNSVVGTGRAKKEQVQEMMRRLLNIEGDIQSDAADALACAVTCAHSLKLTSLNFPTQRPKYTIRSASSGSAKKRRSAWEQHIVATKGILK